MNRDSTRVEHTLAADLNHLLAEASIAPTPPSEAK